MKVRFLEAARDGLRDAVRYYESQCPGLGAEFRDELRRAIERIKTLPHAWPPLSKNTRRYRTQRFPYGVIYQARGDEILVVAVAHLHRDPEDWKERL